MPHLTHISGTNSAQLFHNLVNVFLPSPEPEPEHKPEPEPVEDKLEIKDVASLNNLLNARFFRIKGIMTDKNGKDSQEHIGYLKCTPPKFLNEFYNNTPAVYSYVDKNSGEFYRFAGKLESIYDSGFGAYRFRYRAVATGRIEDLVMDMNFNGIDVKPVIGIYDEPKSNNSENDKELIVLEDDEVLETRNIFDDIISDASSLVSDATSAADSLASDVTSDADSVASDVTNTATKVYNDAKKIVTNSGAYIILGGLTAKALGTVLKDLFGKDKLDFLKENADAWIDGTMEVDSPEYLEFEADLRSAGLLDELPFGLPGASAVEADSAVDLITDALAFALV